MANEGLKARLKEIHMNEYDAEQYEGFYQQVHSPRYLNILQWPILSRHALRRFVFKSRK